ncbi:MAG TPA: hypothetical protein DD618_04190 [Acholeplasmatales bacterium]|nr:hypothetical protein [Acholeplasmatales bacterium]
MSFFCEVTKMNNKIKWMAKVSIFAALSTVLYFIKFPISVLIPIFPTFLEVQFSNLPAIIGGLALGPYGGAIIVLIRCLIKLPFSHTAYVGELADLIIGLAVVLTSSLIYKYHHTKRGGVLGIVFGGVAWVIAGALANYFILMPFFIGAWGFDAVFGMLTVIPGITEANYMFYYIMFAIVPFNLILATVVGLVTFFVYKRTSMLLHRM